MTGSPIQNALFVLGMVVAFALVAFSMRVLQSAAPPASRAWTDIEAVKLTPGGYHPDPGIRRTTKVVPATLVRARSAAVSAGAATFSFGAPTHRPAVGRSWRIVATAVRDGRRLAGRVRIHVLFQGQSVGHVDTRRFRGVYAKTIRWPRAAAGHQLALRAMLEVGGLTRSFVYPIRVRTPRSRTLNRR